VVFPRQNSKNGNPFERGKEAWEREKKKVRNGVGGEKGERKMGSPSNSELANDARVGHRERRK